MQAGPWCVTQLGTLQTSDLSRPLSGTNHRNLVLGVKGRKNVQCLSLLVPAEQSKFSSSREGSAMEEVLGQKGDRNGVSALYGFRGSETLQTEVTPAVRTLGGQGRG